MAAARPPLGFRRPGLRLPGRLLPGLRIAARGLARALTAPLRRLRPAGRGFRPPDRLLVAPGDPRTADPTLAADLYAGHLAFAGRVVTAGGRSPFALPAPSAEWARALHGFAWLRHLAAADTALARGHAQALVADWIAGPGRRPGGLPFEPAVAARRLLSWLSASPLLLAALDDEAYRAVMRALARDARGLSRALARGAAAGEDRALALVALAAYGLAARGAAPVLRRATRALDAELEHAVLPDGGHVSRDPAALLDLALDLLPLRGAYAARRAAPPPALQGALDRAMPMLRMMRRADGRLSLFNGAGHSAPSDLAAVLAHDEAGEAALLAAPYAGYQRLEAGGAVLVADAGPPPPHAFSARAHAGCLSFEFSVRDRAGVGRALVVNCGAPPRHLPEARAAARATAAHSTLVVDGDSSLRLRRGLVVDGPRRVAAERGEAEGARVLALSHDGWRTAHGVVHERRLALAPDGARLEGEDWLRAGGGARAGLPYALRFHLAPGTGAEEGAEGARLVLPGGEAWAFEAGGLRVAVEEGVAFAAPAGARRALQLVVEARLGEPEAVEWSFTRLAPREEARATEREANDDPGRF